jgi:hypothetical protein
MAKKLALLDAQKTLTAIADVADDAWADGPDQVRVPNDCDLVPQRFRWTGTEFVAIAAASAVLATRRPLAMTVLALREIKKQLNVNYPAKVDNWLADEYQQIKAAKEE